MMTTDTANQDIETRMDLAVRRDAIRQPGMSTVEGHTEWHLLSSIPMLLTAAIPVQGFRICDLLNLGAGQTIESASPSSEDVPVSVGGTQVAWSEFEVVGQRMAIRLTRLV